MENNMISSEKSLTFLEYAEKSIERLQKPLTPREIWNEMQELGATTEGKTPWATVASNIYLDIQKSDSVFIKYSKNPLKYFLKRLSDVKINESLIKSSTESTNKDERALHKYLVRFVVPHHHFKTYMKTIHHEDSKKGKKGSDDWRYPDLVGVFFPQEFDSNTLRLEEALFVSSVKLFSFEMKVELTLENLRRSYFQAVSNSSWAHEGYLVASKIDSDPNVMDELRRLNVAFGIGLIELNVENIDESIILLSAKINTDLNWDTINILANKNKDFGDFIEDVESDSQSWRKKSEWKIKGNYDQIDIGVS